MIKTWQQRCEEHPDHDGIVSEGMIQARMQEEIDELRAAIEQAQQVFDRKDVLQVINDLNEVDAVLEACQVKQDVGTDRANAVLCSLLKLLDGAYLQPEQEPVAWMNPSWIDPDTRGWASDSFESIEIEGWVPLYTAPRQWQGLTADEIWQCNAAPHESAVEYHICMAHQNVLDFAEAIEAKLKEKNRD